MFEDEDSITNLFINEDYWKSEAHFMQTPAWVSQYETNPEYKCFYSYIGNEVSAYSLARIRKIPLLGKLMRIEWGPIAKNIGELEKHLSMLKDEPGYIQIEISPYSRSISNDEMSDALKSESFTKRTFRRANYSHTVMLDLNPELEDIRRVFRRSLKTQINKSIRFGIEIRKDDQLDDLIVFYNKFALKNDLQSISIEEQAFLKIRKGKSLFLSAYYKNKMVGVVFLLENHKSIVYQWGASLSSSEYKKVPITHLLHWTGIELAKEYGFEGYDFGGYWKEKGDADSINRFKTGFTKNIQTVNNEYIYSKNIIRNKIIEHVIKKRISS